MNDEGDSLKDEIELIKCMYPEIKIKDHSDELLEGVLDVCMEADTSIMVQYGDQAIDIDELPYNKVHFVIEKCYYPDYNKSLEWKIQSPWLTDEDCSKIRELMSSEFQEMSNEVGSPLIYLLLDTLSHRALSTLTTRNNHNDKRIYDCKDAGQWEKFQHLKSDFETYQQLYENYRCCICIEDKKGFDMVRLPCSSHLLCKDCIKEYYHTMIHEGRIESIRCPECDYKPRDLSSFKSFDELKTYLFLPAIPYDFFSGLLNDKDVERYKTLHIQEAFMKLAQYSPYSCVRCPSCENWCAKDDLDEQMVCCNSCEMVFCFDCLHAWHGKYNSCGTRVAIDLKYVEEYADECTTPQRKRELEIKFGKRMMELELDSYLADRMFEMFLEDKNSGTTKCPGCQTVIEKSEGCNKMKCTVCLKYFCFLCRAMLHQQDPYAHYNDPFSPCMGKLFEGMPGTEQI
ncbi:translation termination inhibitor protein ITT1 [Kluyveromyces marxianus]|nr:translation termination inhibitor protein ITT1 [Kluyveromyces marxianus]